MVIDITRVAYYTKVLILKNQFKGILTGNEQGVITGNQNPLLRLND